MRRVSENMGKPGVHLITRALQPPKKGDVVKTGRTVTASLLLFGSLMFCENESVRLRRPS